MLMGFVNVTKKLTLLSLSMKSKHEFSALQKNKIGHTLISALYSPSHIDPNKFCKCDRGKALQLH